MLGEVGVKVPITAPNATATAIASAMRMTNTARIARRVHARATRRGAHAIGVDGSERLIKIARQRACDEGVNVQFVHANPSALIGITSAGFDVVVAAMSLMDVENYEGAIREVCRVLSGGGELVMSITHPCFSAPLSEWIRGSSTSFLLKNYST
jgi:ubiquinone/menaquinone biosynthesis C-methylase UbiE